MIEEQAVVIRVHGASADLEIERSSPCGLCGATRGCGISLWGTLFGNRRRSFAVANDLGVVEGDHVVVGVNEGVLLAGSLSAYLVPLVLVCIGALGGAALAQSRTTSDFYAVVGALTGLLLGLVWVRFVTAAGSAQHGLYRPVMLRRADFNSVRQR
jgi:sigma-E factor negative regulatory protein RseC